MDFWTLLFTVIVIIADVLGQENENSPSNCPTGGGSLQVSGGSSNTFLDRGGLMNFIFVCGTYQVPYEVPARWVLREGINGTTVNVTIYETKHRTLPLCCPGYTRNEKDMCVPKCKGGCSNGICASPGNCICFEGYTLNNIGECVVTCPCGCSHGKCSGNTCNCDFGYIMENDVCNPVCENGCENGDCLSPNNCTCHIGYMKQENGTCQPHCSNGCKNGICTGADVCVCLEGFYKQNNTGLCIPRCKGCEHGNCVKPYDCHCHKGYKREDEDCKPICKEGCNNSTCTAPDKCSCFSGYVKVTSNTCRPHCTPRCKNAHCVAPNECQCFEGYNKKAYSIKSHECVSLVNQVVNAIGSVIHDIKYRH